MTFLPAASRGRGLCARRAAKLLLAAALSFAWVETAFANAVNVLMMTAGFALMGLQITGYLVAA